LNIVGTLLLDRVVIVSVPRQLSHNVDSRNNPYEYELRHNKQGSSPGRYARNDW
jgi:hypothetical protein